MQDDTVDVIGPRRLSNARRCVSPLPFPQRARFRFVSHPVDLFLRVVPNGVTCFFPPFVYSFGVQFNKQARGRRCGSFFVNCVTSHVAPCHFCLRTSLQTAVSRPMCFSSTDPSSSSSSVCTQSLIALPSFLPQHRFPHPLLLFSFF